MKCLNYLLLVAIISLTIGCVSDERSVDEIASSASSSFERGDYQSAAEEYTNLIDKIKAEGDIIEDSEKSLIYTMRGLSYFNLNDYNKAVSDYSEAIKLDLNNAVAYAGRAQVYFRLGKEALMKDDIVKATALGFDISESDIKSTASQTPTQSFSNSLSNGINPYEDLPKIPTLQYNKQFESVKLSAESNNEAAKIIEKATVKKVTTEELTKLPDRNYLVNDYELTGVAVEIDAEISSAEKADLKDTLYITLKIPDTLIQTAQKDNVGAIYYSPKGPISMKGILSEDKTTVTIPTTHLSIFELSFWKPTKRSEDIIKAEAKKYVYAAGAHIDEQLIEGIKKNQFILGLDEDMKSKVLNNVLANKEKIAELAAIAGGDTSKDAGKSISMLMGKLIVDNMEEDDLKKAFGGNILKNLVDKADLIGEVTENTVKGDYMASVEAVGRNIADEMMITKAVKAGAAGWQVAIDAWADGKNEQLYQEWKKESDSKDFWDDSNTIKGIPAFYRNYAIKTPGCYGDEKAQSCIRKMFNDRKEKDEAITKEEKKLKELYDIFNKDGYTSVRGDMEKRLKETSGEDSVSKEMVFEYFIKNMRQVEAQLKSIGIEGQAWNNNRLSDDALKLIQAFSEGGEAAKYKAFKELQLRESKQLKLKSTATKTPTPTPTKTAKQTPTPTKTTKSGGGSGSGTFPDAPFNEMQITYSFSGASITSTEDISDFTTSRTLKGTLGTGNLAVSGNAKGFIAKCGTSYGSFYVYITVDVWAGSNKKTYTSPDPINCESASASYSFSLSVPIPEGATEGGFAISETYVNPRSRDRALVVSGSFGE